MKVLIAGVNREGALARMCLKAMRALGCECSLFDYRSQASKTGSAAKLPGVRRLDRLARVHRANQLLLREATSGSWDLVLVLKGELIAPKTLAAIRSQSRARLVNWNPDDPFEPSITTRALVAGIPEYDIYFTWGKRLVGRLREAGARHVEYLPFGYDPDTHLPVRPDAARDAERSPDISFCGTWTLERERLLGRLAGCDLGIWGNGWESLGNSSPLRDRQKGPAIYDGDLSQVYGSSRIVLNLLRQPNRGSHNMRSFEIPATGAFQLSTRSEGLAEWFREDHEIACFESPDELEDKVIYYLGREGERKAVATAGHRRVVEGCHSYADRMEELLNKIESITEK